MKAFAALSVIFALGLAALAGPKAPEPVSGVGYLRFDADTEIQPKAERIFLKPASKLLLQSETPDCYFLILPESSGSSLCRMPKVPKFVLQLRFDENASSIYLRAGLELDCVPFKFMKGQELPLASIDASSWLVICSANPGAEASRRYNVAIPSSTKTVSFSKLSAYDIFLRDQAAKGLSLYKGEWITKERAAALAKAEKEAENLKDDRFERLRKVAMTGYIVMADKSLLPGIFRGADGDRVLFETRDGDSRWISPSETLDVPVLEVMGMGALFETDRLLVQASKKLHDGEFAAASKGIDEASDAFAKIPEGAKPGAAALASARNSLQSFKDDLKRRLAEAGMALYSGGVFPEGLLKWQLAQGNILFRSSIWLKPGQICQGCGGTGSKACPDCHATGQVKVPCANCSASGRIVCPLCQGSGGRACSICRGTGAVMRKCSHCGGSGYTYSYGPSVFYAPPRQTVVVNSAGGSIIGIPGPYVIGGGAAAQTPCPYCGGTGSESSPCGTCGGRGTVDCPKTVRCPVCEGRGFNNAACQTCSGKGHVQCGDCSGKGYSGEPQTMDSGAKTPANPAGPTQSRPQLSPL